MGQHVDIEGVLPCVQPRTTWAAVLARAAIVLHDVQPRALLDVLSRLQPCMPVARRGDGGY